MPIPVLRARVAVFGLALATTLSLASIAEAKSIPAELRVVDSDGTGLAEQTQYTSKDGIEVKSDPGTKCFIGGAGGSGEKVTVPGPTAFSLLADAGATTRDTRPLSLTDEFSFGLGLCGIGDAVATTDGYWYLKVGHAAARAGGDQIKVKPGLDVLWYLIADASQTPPTELVLSAPSRAKLGADVKVKVVSYADDGTRSPAEGVTVSGSDAPTDAAGRTTVPADSDLLELTATREGSIPSNEEAVCTLKVAECPAGYAKTIAGTRGGDKITTGKGAETVLAGGGDDRIRAVKGGSAPDLVKCGGGKDKVTGYGKKRGSTRFVGCEKVR